ncbi:hypothetical protein Ami103574_00545 [Aminipila butyrica]|uniref:DUF1129 family protein n=1 Tax=Aminipila butyrica TaxID=433296 RepID=A0A858BQU0_9FIRM|nr:hypothetical protein [Aminipila butyrica]QIB67887.1 hypothetical protein Ami103574_00545 [Aminipila butyrica]
MNKETKQLLKENNQLSKQLKPHNDEILTNIVVYLRGANISDYQQEVLRRDITQMILDGESRGQDIQQIIGSDYKEFCDEILLEVPQLTLQDKVASFVQILCLGGAVLCSIWLSFGILDDLFATSTWPYLPLTVGNLVSSGLAIGSALIIFTILCRTAFDLKGLNSKKMVLLFFVLMTVCILANTLLTKVLMSVHMVAALAVVLALYLGYKLLDKR